MHLIETFGLGGAEVLLANTLPLLKARVDVRVRALAPPEDLCQEFQRAGVNVEFLRGETNTDRSLGNLALRLRRELSQAPADIVHTHLFKATLVGRMMRLMMLTGPRLVTTLHSPDYSNPETPSHWRGVARQVVDWTSAMATNDAIVAVSEAVASDFRSHMGSLGPWGRIEVIHNAINVDQYIQACESVDREAARRTHGWASGQIGVLAIGRLIASKNFGSLIESIALLRQRGIDAVGLVLGDGPERSDLERKAGGLVRFKGLVSRDDVIEALVACDIYAQPSRWEAFGLAILEAMAAGRPVVASAVDGIREVVSDQQTGILVPSENPVLFADALTRLARDRERRRQLGEDGRTRAQRLFGIETWVESTTNLYARLCPTRE